LFTEKWEFAHQEKFPKDINRKHNSVSLSEETTPASIRQGKNLQEMAPIIRFKYISQKSCN